LTSIEIADFINQSSQDAHIDNLLTQGTSGLSKKKERADAYQESASMHQ